MAADFEANLGIPQICELVEKRREELAAKAAENKSLSYVRLYSKQELMAFIYKYRVPVLITLDAANLDNLLDRESYHALAAYGWRDDGAYIKFSNSWGDAWGEQGKGEIAFAEILEMWGLIETEIIELTDIDGHWAELEIRRTVADGILCGYPDHTFAPDKPLTRAELAVLWTRMKNALKGE